ncbi:MAG TPA: hypothetical protein VNT26_20025 [Candidatus Sulfotelmatobacter sp.]|nr:hypothetical protein [Candidatus Sulfotelmatobacter sp.]
MAGLRTITNSYLDVQVWDLDPSEARGPFIVVQGGCAPGDERAEDRFFVLRRDGCWVDITYYLVNSKPEALDEAVFDTTGEIIQLLEGLGGRPQVADLKASDEELRAWHQAHPHVVPGLPGIRRWVADYQQRRHSHT